MKKYWIRFKNTDFYRTYKEEMIIVPLILFVFFIFNSFLVYMFPQGAFFDYYSQIETIFSKVLVFLVSLWTAHLALRMSFPKIYKFLHENIYHNFDNIPTDKKIEYSINFIIAFIIASSLIFG